MATVFHAPAKINLALQITGRRGDGYHTLDSLIAFSPAIADDLHITPADNFTFTMDGPFATTLEADDNLVVRAARGLATLLEADLQCHIRLTKNLPVAAGIGGGSSDAAATITALLDFWHIDGPADGLDALLLSLGTDVPVCALGTAARVRGVGEVTEPLSAALPPVYAVLVNPLIPCPTPAVFKALAPSDFSGDLRGCPPRFDNAADMLTFLRVKHNDLTRAATAQVPDIETALSLLALQEGCALARLSGSGATCFGLFETPEKAAAAMRAIARSQPDWWIKSTPLV